MADTKISAETAVPPTATDSVPGIQSGGNDRFTFADMKTFFDRIPQNSKSVNYTTVLADAGHNILHPSADNNPRTFTIDSNANVAYPVDTVLNFTNLVNTVTIAIASDTLILAGPGTTGPRSLAANGVASALKVASTTWIISGTGLT